MLSDFSPWVLLFVLSATIAAFAQMLLKKSATEKHDSVIGEYLNWKVIVGYGLMFLGMLLGVVGYSKGVQIKSAAVTESIGIVEVAVLSDIFFGEKLTKRKIIGIGLILAGIVLFNIA
ncbi:MAG: EamA family transporter [Lachnospiraceae bacterium]|nr:EamA family transporter [Lachnospiraceae bacterium]